MPVLWRYMAFYIFIFLVLSLGSATLPILERETLNKTNIDLPEGSRYITKDHLLCTPSTWKTIVPFYFANYLAHVATVKTLPGESRRELFFALSWAFFFPTLAMARGLQAIYRAAVFGKTPLAKACRAGALCVFIHTQAWKAPSSDERTARPRSSSGLLTARVATAGDSPNSAVERRISFTPSTELDMNQNSTPLFSHRLDSIAYQLPETIDLAMSEVWSRRQI